jgi:hypothetical protein
MLRFYRLQALTTTGGQATDDTQLMTELSVHLRAELAEHIARHILYATNSSFLKTKQLVAD